MAARGCTVEAAMRQVYDTMAPLLTQAAWYDALDLDDAGEEARPQGGDAVSPAETMQPTESETGEGGDAALEGGGAAALREDGDGYSDGGEAASEASGSPLTADELIDASTDEEEEDGGTNDGSHAASHAARTPPKQGAGSMSGLELPASVAPRGASHRCAPSRCGRRPPLSTT